MTVLTKLKRTIGNTVTMWEFLSILAIFGAATTTSLLVKFVRDSPSPLLIIVASFTCVFFAFSLVIGLRKAIHGSVLFGISAGLVIWTAYLANDFVHSPEAAKSPPVPHCLWISAALTLLVAIAAVIIFYLSKKKPLNPVFTWTNNGVSLLGILASALTFNFPLSWALWGQGIGWLIIFLTLVTLWPVWKSAAIAASDKSRADEADAAACQAKLAEKEARLAQKAAESRADKADAAACQAKLAEKEARLAQKAAESRADKTINEAKDSRAKEDQKFTCRTFLAAAENVIVSLGDSVRKKLKNERP